jgi:predicted GNAT family acetyltransferase
MAGLHHDHRQLEAGDHVNVSVTDNPSALRYELHVGNELAGEIRYRRQPGAVVLVHTNLQPRFEGDGLGSRLVQGALDDIRARGCGVVPVCPFVAAFIRHHPEYADLVTSDMAVSG